VVVRRAPLRTGPGGPAEAVDTRQHEGGPWPYNSDQGPLQQRRGTGGHKLLTTVSIAYRTSSLLPSA
jgi:hypothetical protein